MQCIQVELNLSLLEDISDDIDFCFKLAKEESVIILPGTNMKILLIFVYLFVESHFICTFGEKSFSLHVAEFHTSIFRSFSLVFVQAHQFFNSNHDNIVTSKDIYKKRKEKRNEKLNMSLNICHPSLGALLISLEMSVNKKKLFLNNFVSKLLLAIPKRKRNFIKSK